MCGSEDRYGEMNTSGALTAAQAIRKECRFCTWTAQANCTTKVCKLHPDVFKCRSSVKRIKAHCQDCAVRDLTGNIHQAVRDCTGELLRDNGNEKICSLYPFRFGKNPTRTKYPSPPKRKPSVIPNRGRNTAAGSTISSESEKRRGDR